MNAGRSKENRYESRVRDSNVKLARWTSGWLISAALLSFGPKFLWDKSVPITLVAFSICILVGVGMILANRAVLQVQDELVRKVNLDAMAITLGVVVIAGIPYSTLETYEIVPQKGDIAILMLLMAVTYLVSLILGLRRYR
jgi:hypothetical protein